jgi:hypothetical protein
MSSFQKRHCSCCKGSDGGCSREPPAASAQNDPGRLERTVTDAAGAGCGSEYVVMDNDWKELVEVPGTDEASRVDVAAESRQSVGAEDAAVAVVGLAVLDGDDAGTEMLVETRRIDEIMQFFVFVSAIRQRCCL